MHCAVATPKDDEAIRRLLRDNAMGGGIRITLEREPNYFLGTDIAGGIDQTILVSRESQLGCVGRCTRRKCWVNGEPRTVGYLAELRLDDSVRGQAEYLRRGYQFFESLQANQPADVYFTSIASDNHRAIRFLERGIRGLPRYKYLNGLTTVLISVPTRSKHDSTRVERASSHAEVARVLNLRAQSRQFAAVWTEENLQDLAERDLPLNRFHLVSRGDEAVACAALWDQRSFRQTVIQSYPKALSCVLPVFNFVSGLFGHPGLPRSGSALPHAFLSPLACDENDLESLHALIESYFPIARENGLRFLTLAFPEGDARLRSVRTRYRTREWSSRLYRVDWPGQPTMELDPKLPLLPDVALL